MKTTLKSQSKVKVNTPALTTRSTVKIDLKPAKNSPLFQAFELSLIVRREWWTREGIHEKLSNGKRQFFMTLDQIDLFVSPFNKPSILTLFKRKITLARNNRNIKVQVNITVEVPEGIQTYKGLDLGFEGIVTSGSISFEDLTNTFAPQEWEWLTQNPSPDTELLLGSSKIQLKLPPQPPSISAPSLYDFVGLVDESANIQCLWKQIDCPHERVSSPSDTLTTHETNVRNKLIENANSSAISVEQFEQPGSGIYKLVGIKDGGLFEETYLKPRLKIFIFQEGSTQSAFTWIPQSLVISNNGEYAFYDYDQIEELLKYKRPPSTSGEFELSVEWKSTTERKIRFTTPLYPSHTSNSNAMHTPHLWQMGQIDSNSSAFKWIRHTLEEFPTTNEINEGSSLLPSQSETIRGSLLKFNGFNAEDGSLWKILINLPKRHSYEYVKKSQIRLTISSEKTKLEIHAPDILAASPPISFYGKPLVDSSSMPADRIWSNQLVTTPLVFRSLASTSASTRAYRLEIDQYGIPQFVCYAPASDEAETPIGAYVHPLLTYDLAPLAVVDRVSPSRNNLPPPQRDPNHSLIPTKVVEFKYEFGSTSVVLKPSRRETSDKFGTEALLPWVERAFTSSGSQQTLYHRNLISEHAEFELGEAFLDKDTSRALYDASNAFIRAVRDRYCAAGENLASHPRLKNWLEHLTLTHGNVTITSLLKYFEPNAGEENQSEFPKVRIEWKKGEEVVSTLTQELSIDSTTSKWLDYYVKPNGEAGSDLTIDIKADGEDHYKRVINSHTPLLFKDNRTIDNLGVMRNGIENVMVKEDASETWKIESIKSENNFITLSGSNITISEGEVYLTCDALLLELSVIPDENIVKATPPDLDSDFHNTRINLGAYGFYSNVTASMFPFGDYWPRYKGVPFFVTKIREFRLNNEHKPISMKFDGVLMNPFDPENTFRSTRTARFQYQFSSSTLTMDDACSGIDWWLSASQSESNHPITGRLTRLLANAQTIGDKVELSGFFEDSNLKYVDALGGFWNVDNTHPFTLRSNTNVNSSNVQTLYEFIPQHPDLDDVALLESGTGVKVNASTFTVQTIDKETTSSHEYYGSVCYINEDAYLVTDRIQNEIDGMTIVHYSIDASRTPLPSLNQFSYQIKEIPYIFLSATPLNPKRKLHYHLPFNMTLRQGLPNDAPDSSEDEENLNPILSNDGRLIFYLKKATGRTHILIPKIIQGNTYGFLFQNSERSILLWLERGQLAALVVSNLTTSSSFTSFCIQSDAYPCTPSFLTGIQVHYLPSGTGSWKRYATISAILNYSNYTLRFDDQMIPDPANDFPSSDSEVLSTANLEFGWSSSEGQVQGPVLVKFTKVNDTQLAIEFPQQWFSLTSVQIFEENAARPDVQFLSGETRKKYFLKRALPKKGQENQEFVTFSFEAGEFVFKKILDHLVPLNFCLEPNAIVRTSKLKKSVPQQVHRQVFGTMMRIDLTQQIYRPTSTEYTDYNLRATAEKWRLNPIAINSKEQPVVMSDDAWLEEDSASEAESQCETESVLILNRPASADTSQPPYVALSNRTLGTTPLTTNRKKEIRKKVMEAGVSGIILHRVIGYDGSVRYDFVPSPFYTSSLPSQPTTVPMNALSNVCTPTSHVHIDFRSLEPRKTVFLQPTDAQNNYTPTEHPSPHTLNPCTPMRKVSYRYMGDMKENFNANQQQPSLYLFENPAYIDMDPLWYLSSRFQQTTHQTIGASHYFLPYLLSIEYGPDKAGALFHHEMRNVVHHLNSQMHKMGRNIDFAMRDPQRIKTQGCITAAIESLEVEETLPDTPYSSKIYRANWEDVFGRVDISNLNDDYQFSAHNLERFEYRVEHEPDQLPLKVIVHHNFDVYELLDKEAALPAYYDEENSAYTWASYYLAYSSEACLPNNLPMREEVLKPDGEAEMLVFNFTPHLLVAKVPFSAFEGNRITLKKSADAEHLKKYGTAAKLFVPGLHALMPQEATLPLTFEVTEDGKIQLPDVSQLFEFSDEKTAYVVYPLLRSSPSSSSSNFVRALHMDDIPFIPNHSCFQIIWISSANRTTENGNVKQAASCKFYTVPKVVKGLMKSLTPKIAGVIQIGDTVKKTLFFGNSASSDQAQYTIESNALKLYADDTETIEIALPSQSLSLQKFYLLKYLVHGQVVYDSYSPHST